MPCMHPKARTPATLAMAKVRTFLNNRTKALSESVRAAADNVAKSEISVEVTYPWSKNFVFSAIVLDVDTPEAGEDHNVVEVGVKLSISGTVTRNPAAKA